ncbi:protein translocase subunit SecF [Streptomyces sp. RFCAC02]|uniref:protein translocase subunit SecF n=1 Tax=Streptomyces sp. RFCAC02 TaxID=2499143 RepID=UPI0010208D35|nr:protein translocase subunit SecF [Streptomyces sp. RFCAC02]
MSRLGAFGAKLYRGDVTIDFVGRRKIWYGISILITLLAFGAFFVRGLHMGVEFEGGASFTTPETSLSRSEIESIVEDETGHLPQVTELGGSDGAKLVKVAGLDTDQSNSTRAALAEALDIPTDSLNAEVIGPSWGDQIANKAWQGLGIFMVLVVIYLAIAFEWRMALAALIALVHDITITVGVYALVGFEVTPGTVIGLLTILGYSLYDTVVVFDGLKEQTRNFTRQTRHTYADLANRSLNGTLVRSINTSVVALLPVAALLFIGGGLLGGGMLNDIALSLFVGLAAGAYSSIVIATPLVADFKMREPAIRAQDRKVLARRAKRGDEPEGGADGADDSDRADDEDDEDDEDDGATGSSGTGHETRDSAPGAQDDAADDADDDRAVSAGAGARRAPRRQPPSRARGRGRPSGKRR